MGRNSELIRQWTLLQQLATRRGNTIPKLATELRVTPRTIRRDLEALQTSGFPVYDEMVNGAKFWRLKSDSLVAALARNALTLPELWALYSSRALVKSIVGTHTLTDLQGALGKIEAALPPAMKKFLDRLPSIVTAKPAPGRRRGSTVRDVTTRLFEAATTQHVVSMRYHSQESRREKEYTVHPYRLVYAQNGLYLQAFVPSYHEFRTFLVDRIQRFSIEQQTFDRVAELGTDAFSKSMGVHSGPTERIQLRFAPAVAPLIKERIWHESQQLKDRADGSVVMTLQVCDDYALQQWILGFGRSVRVLGPPTLVEWIANELDEARQQYGADGSVRILDRDVQPALPFLFSQISSA